MLSVIEVAYPCLGFVRHESSITKASTGMIGREKEIVLVGSTVLVLALDLGLEMVAWWGRDSSHMIRSRLGSDGDGVVGQCQ